MQNNFNLVQSDLENGVKKSMNYPNQKTCGTVGLSSGPIWVTDKSYSTTALSLSVSNKMITEPRFFQLWLT